MKITIACVGKIKEAFYRDAIKEYTKRLSRYAVVNVEEVRDEPTPERASEKERENILGAEGERLLKKLGSIDRIYALDIQGKTFSSEEFAQTLQRDMSGGAGHIAFVIGGSLGLSGEVLSAAHGRISFSRMTFPHQLMRVILLEQIYRGFRIMRNEPYHK